MNLRTNPTWVLTAASLKMWFRDRQAIFWTFFLPLVIMVIFGVLNFGDLGAVEVGVVDDAETPASQALVANLLDFSGFAISQQSAPAERRALTDGDRDLVLVIPAGFGVSPDASAVRVLYNESRDRESQVGLTVVRQILDEMTFALTEVPGRFVADPQPVSSRNLRYIDFLMPGIVAMSIMQMGLFSVAFSFVRLKNRGILRRLLATPVRPSSFLFAQVFTRLTVSIIQTLILIGVAALIFNVQIAGNLAAVLLLALLGGAVFVSLGFAISGWANSEDVAAPLANVIALPMMFLSGVFFPRTTMPEALQVITGYLPLTYLADSMRDITIDGQVLWAQWPEVVGLAVWLAITFTIAVRLFRWE